MELFRKTSHLSEILEESEKQKVIIFKYSSECGSSDVLKEKMEKEFQSADIGLAIFIVVVQEMPVLSKKIEEFFSIKHESPQIILIHKNKLVSFASHGNTDIKHLFLNSA